MQVEIPPRYETELTGYVGSAIHSIKGVEYSVRFTWQAGELTAMPHRGGKLIDWTPALLRLEKSGRKFFTPIAA